MTRTLRLAPVTVIVVAVSLMVVGCSSTSSQASSLATTASDASAAAQTASFDLRLLNAGKTTSGVSDTALGDAITALDQADSSLTQIHATGGLEKLSSKSLALVRQAEDLTRASQSLSDKPHSSLALKELASKLHRISTLLSRIETELKATL